MEVAWKVLLRGAATRIFLGDAAVSVQRRAAAVDGRAAAWGGCWRGLAVVSAPQAPAWESLGEPGRAWESLGEPGRAWIGLQRSTYSLQRARREWRGGHTGSPAARGRGRQCGACARCPFDQTFDGKVLGANAPFGVAVRSRRAAEPPPGAPGALLVCGGRPEGFAAWGGPTNFPWRGGGLCAAPGGGGRRPRRRLGWLLDGSPSRQRESKHRPGRAWESLGEPGRAWESLGEPGRAWESLGEPGRAWIGLQRSTYSLQRARRGWRGGHTGSPAARGRGRQCGVCARCPFDQTFDGKVLGANAQFDAAVRSRRAAERPLAHQWGSS